MKDADCYCPEPAQDDTQAREMFDAEYLDWADRLASRLPEPEEELPADEIEMGNDTFLTQPVEF